jgi:hypothetical protein
MLTINGKRRIIDEFYKYLMLHGGAEKAVVAAELFDQPLFKVKFAVWSFGALLHVGLPSIDGKNGYMMEVFPFPHGSSFDFESVKSEIEKILDTVLRLDDPEAAFLEVI